MLDLTEYSRILSRIVTQFEHQFLLRLLITKDLVD